DLHHSRHGPYPQAQRRALRGATHGGNDRIVVPDLRSEWIPHSGCAVRARGASPGGDMAVVIPARLRRWLRFGMGVGIVAGDHELEIVVARARPNGVSVAGTLRVPNYLQRPAAEWGAEVAQMLA